MVMALRSRLELPSPCRRTTSHSHTRSHLHTLASRHQSLLTSSACLWLCSVGGALPQYCRCLASACIRPSSTPPPPDGVGRCALCCGPWPQPGEVARSRCAGAGQRGRGSALFTLVKALLTEHATLFSLNFYLTWPTSFLVIFQFSPRVLPLSMSSGESGDVSIDLAHINRFLNSEFHFIANVIK